MSKPSTKANIISILNQPAEIVKILDKKSSSDKSIIPKSYFLKSEKFINTYMKSTLDDIPYEDKEKYDFLSDFQKKSNINKEFIVENTNRINKDNKNMLSINKHNQKNNCREDHFFEKVEMNNLKINRIKKEINKAIDINNNSILNLKNRQVYKSLFTYIDNYKSEGYFLNVSLNKKTFIKSNIFSSSSYENHTLINQINKSNCDIIKNKTNDDSFFEEMNSFRKISFPEYRDFLNKRLNFQNN